MLGVAVDILAPASGEVDVLRVADGDGEVGVEGPGFPLGLVVDDGVQVIDEAGVVDRQEVFDLDGQEVQVVG